jgi:hypothetical protein
MSREYVEEDREIEVNNVTMYIKSEYGESVSG